MTEQDSTSSNAPGRLQPRIMVINATPLPTSPATVNGDGVTKAKSGGESRGGYVGMMNCVFATQKAVSLPGLDSKDWLQLTLERRKSPSMS